MSQQIFWDAAPEISNTEQYMREVACGFGLFRTERELRESPHKDPEDKVFMITIQIEEVK